MGRAQGFLATWRRRACPLTGLAHHADHSYRVLAGVRRVLLSAPGGPLDVHLELHHDGAGFGAVVLIGGGQEGQVGVGQSVLRDEVELTAQALVSLLAAHAADTGAGGELMLRAQLLLVELMGTGYAPTKVYAARRVPGGLVGPPSQLPQTLKLEATTPMDSTTLLGEVAADVSGTVRAAYPLAADVLAEFGVPEPAVLRPDGGLVLDSLDPRYHQRVRDWAAGHGLVDDAG